MAEPITLTVGTIAALAFTKFLESSAGEAGKQLMPGVLKKMDELRQKIWIKLRGIHDVDALIASVERGSKVSAQQINNVLVPHLEAAMKNDENFAKEIQALARGINQEINIGEILGENVMNVYGGEAVQINDPKAPVLQGISGGTIHITNNNY